MSNTLQYYLNKYRDDRNFNPAVWVTMRSQQLNDYMKRCGLENVVVSVSGGIDSAVVASVACYASNMANSVIKKVILISQPIHSSGWTKTNTADLKNVLGTEVIEIDSTEVYNLMHSRVRESLGSTGDNLFADGQLKSYLRTPVNYYVSQLVGKCIVLGTGNKDEDGYLGYFCKAGDGVVDLAIIDDLHKSEVYKVGRFMEVPRSILSCAPSADLWEGQTDEEELGMSYDFIELFTGYYLGLETTDKQKEFIDSLTENDKVEFMEKKAKAERIHNQNKHKFHIPFSFCHM